MKYPPYICHSLSFLPLKTCLRRIILHMLSISSTTPSPPPPLTSMTAYASDLALETEYVRIMNSNIEY